MNRIMEMEDRFKIFNAIEWEQCAKNNIEIENVPLLCDCLSSFKHHTILSLTIHELGHENTKILFSSMKKNQNIKNLILCYSHLLDDSNLAENALYIANFHESNQSLESLEYNSMKVSHESMKIIVNSLKCDGFLKSLRFNSLKEEEATAIAPLLDGNCTLQSFGVSSSGKLSHSIESIGNALETNVCLKDLNLEGVTFDDSGGMAIAATLKKNKFLKNLWLGNYEMSESILEIIRSLTYVEGFHLNLCWTQLYGGCSRDPAPFINRAICLAAAIEIGEMLSKNSTITELDLSNFYMGGSYPSRNPVSFHIAKGLELNKSLESLTLNHCYFGDNGGALAIVKAVNTHPCLKILHINSKYIEKNECIEVLKVLESNTKLTTLSLEFSEHMQDLGFAISSFLKANQSLKVFCLDLYRLTDSESAAIAESLEDNSTLKELDMLNIIGLGSMATKAFSKMLKVNKSLTSLSVTLDLEDTNDHHLAISLLEAGTCNNKTLEKFVIDRNYKTKFSIETQIQLAKLALKSELFLTDPRCILKLCSRKVLQGIDEFNQNFPWIFPNLKLRAKQEFSIINRLKVPDALILMIAEYIDAPVQIQNKGFKNDLS